MDLALALLAIVFSIAGTWLFDSGNFGLPLCRPAHVKNGDKLGHLACFLSALRLVQ